MLLSLIHTTEGILCKIETEDVIDVAQELGSVVKGCHPPNCILEDNPPGETITCETDTEKTLRRVTRGYQDEDMQHGGEAVKTELTKRSEEDNPQKRHSAVKLTRRKHCN